MTRPPSRRPKLVLFPGREGSVRPKAGQTEDDYAIYASYRPQLGGAFVGTLKVVRLTDARLLYPFEGVSEIGPYTTKQAAKEAAMARGSEIVTADLCNPEL